MSRIGMVGVGAIGGYFASQLARAGHELQLCVRTTFERLVVETDGEKIEVDAPVLTDTRSASGADWVFLGTKSHQTAQAADWLNALCGPETRAVVVMQNGVEQVERVAPLVRGTEVLPAIVLCGAESVRPGHVVHHGFQNLEVPGGELADGLAELFAGSSAEVTASRDFTTALWRKLLQNSVASPLTALTGRRLGVFRRAEMRELALGVAKETVAVAESAGAKLTDDDALAVVRGLLEVSPEMGSSMLYDRLAGRPLEHDAITGAVVRFGERAGIPTPQNRALLALLQATSGD